VCGYSFHKNEPERIGAKAKLLGWFAARKDLRKDEAFGGRFFDLKRRG
jgi:hypothetical protein